MTGRRGAHRVGAWTVSGLVEAVERQAVAARRAHLRSLRRPVPAGQMIWIGDREIRCRFYGVLSDTEGLAALTLTPPEDVLIVPALGDDAPTGPILFARHG